MVQPQFQTPTSICTLLTANTPLVVVVVPALAESAPTLRKGVFADVINPTRFIQGNSLT